MRLRTYESYWLLQNGILYSYPSLQQHSSAQLVVIGGGITGALVSHALMEEGYQVALIDKRDIGAGSTAATTSMLQYEVDVRLMDLSRLISEDAAALCYRAGVDAIYRLQQLVTDLQIDCGFELKKSLYVAHNSKAAATLKEECTLRSKHGLAVQWLDADAIRAGYGLATHGGILSGIAGSVDAYKLAHELIQYNYQRGMQVYDQTEIASFDTEGKDGAVIQTKEGFQLEAEQLVFCSGFETTKILKEDIAHLFYTYATVSEQDIVLNENLKKTLVWDTDDPYTYMRCTDDGRLLVGGEDASASSPFTQQKIKEHKAKKLRQKLEALLPGVQFIDDFNWGGTFGTTKDGLPYIGKSPEYDKALFVLGFGGNGITFSVQAMELIPKLLRGEKSALLHYYRFGR
jgi:glycine/D-amino acid oxidase-like deaminating enzyme